MCKGHIESFLLNADKCDPSLSLFQFCRKAISLFKDRVITSLQNLLQKQCSLWTVSQACATMLQGCVGNSSSFGDDFLVDNACSLSIVEGKYGRQAVGSVSDGKNIPKGSILFRERPLAYCMNYSSKTGVSNHNFVDSVEDVESTVQADHICLAWQIVFVSRRQDASFHKNGAMTSSQSFLQNCRPPSLLITTHHDQVYTETWKTTVSALVILSILSSICALLTQSESDATEKFRNVDEELYEVLRRLPHNTHVVSTILNTSFENSKSSIVSQVVRGMGIFLAASSLNHSCNPNATVRFVESNDESAEYIIELVALRDILHGEELLISYGPTAALPFSKRQEILWTQYLFRCECCLCMEEKKRVENNMINVSDCEVSHAMFQMEQSCIGWVRHCWQVFFEINSSMCHKSPPSHTRMQKNYKQLDDIMQELKEKMDQLIYCETKYNTSMSKACSRNMTELKYTLLDMLGHVSANLKNYELALSYTEQSVELYIHTHCTVNGLPADDIMVSREEVKVIQLLLACGKLEECRIKAVKVLKNMKAYVDVNHDLDYLELERIIQMLDSEKK